MINELRERVENLGIIFSNEIYKNLEIYISTLLDYNKIHNITGADDIDEIVENVFDSIYVLKFLPQFKNILDIGTGAGFPGLILAIVMPNSNFYLVEPNKKRASFLHLIKNRLNLKNVTIINRRVEEIDFIKVDLITSRGVNSINVLLEISKKLIREETQFLFFKGERVFEEINQKFYYRIFKRGNRRYIFIRKLLKDD